MAPEPVPAGELAALHQRISRDLAELRFRWRRWTGPGRRTPDEVVGTVAEAAGALHALQALRSGLRPVLAALADLAGGLRGGGRL
ncbi:MAG: hypothetical protein QN187_01965 [Armatimonadota bacterium]|nr:hypothetical protein [Armatimonadota bacterium]MDR7519080.1 hypothetical protein [Armatimonadota bacterium]MDR7550235.1 hypothetical protein [Armatimonadota bacterium]